MPSLQSLTIRKLSNVAENTHLAFGRAGVVLIGRNGTGKTTLLKLITALFRGEFHELSEDDYDLTFVVLSGRVQLSVDVKSEKATIDHHIDHHSDSSMQSAFLDVLNSTRRSFSVSINVSVDLESFSFQSDHSKTVCTLPRGTTVEQAIPLTRGWLVLLSALTSTEIAGEMREHPLWDVFLDLFSTSTTLVRLDEGLDYFRLLTDRSPAGAYLSATRTVGDKSEELHPRSQHIPTELGRALLSSYRATEGEKYSFGYASSTTISYLAKFCELTGFSSVSVTADLDEGSTGENSEQVTLAPMRFHARRNDVRISHRHLSYGQLRLLSFLHYHACNADVVIADELVNGLHYEWILYCLRSMSSAQAFLTSQNPLLFDFLSFSSSDDVASRFVTCELNEERGFEWRNMSNVDAAEFFDTHQVGLQHASEILKSRGYW